MKKTTIFIFLLICASVIYSQNRFESWDDTYRLGEVSNKLKIEKEYVKKGEAATFASNRIFEENEKK